MPVSRTKQKKTSVADNEFLLKHRVVGAGVLLLFGALFLPWLLSAPGATGNANLTANGLSAAVSENSGLTSLPSPAATSTEVLDIALQAAIADEQTSLNEEVYISKITPLDAQQNSAPSESTQTLLDESEDTAEPKSNNSIDSSQQAQSDNQENVDTVVDQHNSNTDQELDSKTVKSEFAGLESANLESAKKEAASTVKVGWIVQVGVFIEKAGAERVVQDLGSKGFNPSTSIVDTNRGKDSGTRIWLGPFEQRVEAAQG